MTTAATPLEAGTPSRLIAAEIRAELGRRQLSNRQLALMIDGVSYAWINRRISTGETDLTFEDTQRIASALGVPVRRFLTTWLEHAESPSSTDTPWYPTETYTDRDASVVDLWVLSQHNGDGPGVMRTPGTAAA